MSQLSIASLLPFHREVVENAQIDGEEHLRVIVRLDRRFRRRCSRCHALGTMSAMCGVQESQRFAWMIADLCKHLPVSTVAERYGLDCKTVKELRKAALEKEFRTTDHGG